VNAYYGCYLYGLATANVALTQFSQSLLTMEIQAAQMYWHMTNTAVYDSYFATNTMVGNVGGSDVTASTWFGSQPEYTHGINMYGYFIPVTSAFNLSLSLSLPRMPVTPVTSLLFDQSFVEKEWTILGYRLEEIAATLSHISPSCSGHASNSTQ
jgi:endoglucanase Acf2